jgi:hypothetical protein
MDCSTMLLRLAWEGTLNREPSWKLEAGSWKPEAGSGKREAGSGKWEAGSWKLEAGSWKLEAENDCPSVSLSRVGILKACRG